MGRVLNYEFNFIDSYLTPFIKLNLKWIIRLNMDAISSCVIACFFFPKEFVCLSNWHKVFHNRPASPF